MADEKNDERTDTKTNKTNAEMSDDEKRQDQLTTAPKSSADDAAPRIVVSDNGAGVTRIDVADTAAVRPGNPEKQNG